jgi:hypothetical protein
MADEPTKQPDEKKVTKTEMAPRETVTEPKLSAKTKSQQFSQAIRQFPAWSWAIIAVIGFFAVFGGVAAGYMAFHGVKKDSVADFNSPRNAGRYNLRDDQTGNSGTGLRSGMRGGGFGMMGNDASGSTSSNTRLNGVVTAVEGSTLTVAGSGTTVTVKVTDTTTYTGSSKPAAVNDTIIAFGSTTDGVFTATSVRLIRQ